LLLPCFLTRLHPRIAVSPSLDCWLSTITWIHIVHHSRSSTVHLSTVFSPLAANLGLHTDHGTVTGFSTSRSLSYGVELPYNRHQSLTLRHCQPRDLLFAFLHHPTLTRHLDISFASISLDKHIQTFIAFINQRTSIQGSDLHNVGSSQASFDYSANAYASNIGPPQLESIETAMSRQCNFDSIQGRLYHIA